MRGLKRFRCVRVIGTEHAFVQKIRRDHYELGVDVFVEAHDECQVSDTPSGSPIVAQG